MGGLRERAVGALSQVANGLAEYEKSGSSDAGAATTVAVAHALVTDLLDRYANAMPAPLHPDAAQEMLDLASVIEQLGARSGVAFVRDILDRQSQVVVHFVLTNSHVEMGADGKFRFTAVT